MPLSTEFAPAERSDKDQLRQQTSYFSSQWFFSSVLDHVPDMLMILNMHRQIVYANRAALEMVNASDINAVMGARPGELIGCKHSSETEGGCGTTRFCQYCGAASAILRSQRGKPAVEECRITVIREGTEEALDLQVWARPLELHGELYTFFVIADIADRKRRQVLEQLFLHDIMNTASALRGFSWLWGMENVNPEEQQGCIQRIGFLCDRIVDEIEAQRQLIAAENDELELHFATVNSRSILDEAFTVYNRNDILNGRFLHVSPESISIELRSDRTLLLRVLGNMIKNALEGSAPSEMVTIGCRAADNTVAFWVHNPTYIPENIQLQMFSRSFSTKGVGRGLGTYSMKYLTEKYLSGKISFQSTQVQGTTFTASYPGNLL